MWQLLMSATDATGSYLGVLMLYIYKQKYMQYIRVVHIKINKSKNSKKQQQKNVHFSCTEVQIPFTDALPWILLIFWIKVET